MMELCYQILSECTRDDLVRKIGPLSRRLASAFQERDQSGGKWHCVMGRDFGAWITHEKFGILYFSLWDLEILLFKHGG